MNAPQTSRPDWIAANQNVLVAEFARLKARLGGEDEAFAAEMLERAYREIEAPAAIEHLAGSFGLTAFERDLLLLTAGVEADSKLARLCIDADMGGQQPCVSFGLAMAVLAEPHWSALAPTGPLRYWRLIEMGADASLSSCRLTIDERILHYLTGLGYLDRRLHPLLRPVREPVSMPKGQLELARHIVMIVERSGAPLPVLQLWGSDVDGKRDVAAAVAARLGMQLHAMHVADLPDTPQEIEALAALWQREAALLDSALLIEWDGKEPTRVMKRFSEQVGGVTLIAVQEPLELQNRDRRFCVDKPGPRDQLHLWRQMLGRQGERYRESLKGISREFRFSRREIERVAETVVETEGHNGDSGNELWGECLRQQGRRLDKLAERIEPAAHWDDLILAEARKKIIDQLGVQFRNRSTVYDDWGFAARSTRGLGISALFTGESGTGKTMAAEVLANMLHLDLYRIDLSAVVSKYIGETEKNLARVFDAAEGCGIILLFDEADALFGKRSEVKDSHDRYANIEVSYLLQRMEAFRGMAILTTNQKTALDTAFQRRLRFVVNFPFPDAAEREAIWRGIFPPATPVGKLEYEKLARLQVAGGNIRNIALNAAFLASEDGMAVSMAHILSAAHAEADKRERPLGDAETRGWL